ncbi:brassinosteroid-related acyltransferase 1 [Aristolochia californica]|uniref:brassinosteroid-related acyltransferase 1 n=1 Tax=Aristolochia californica TaxID=171875 RepID=UPI0035DB2A1E
MATQNEDHRKISCKKTLSVYPKPLPSRIHFLSLSNLDRKCPTLMYLVLFYKSSRVHENLSIESLFTSLKMGLEGALSVWYPAAGKLILNAHSGKLDLFCNNSGAVLVQADTKVKLSELGDLSHYNKFYEGLVYKPFFSGNFSDMPLVTAQVTKFGCGGYSLGLGISHSLFDGLATLEFLTAWASSTAQRETAGLGSFNPVHDRGRLLVESTQNQYSADKSGEGADGTRVVAFDHLHQLIEQAASTTSVSAGRDLGSCKFSEIGSANQEGYVLKTFHLTGQMIENLKIKVIRGKNVRACSSFEVVAAHLWKARTKAMGLRKDRRVCLQFAVDTRSKMNPPLPKLFSGNAYVLSSVSSAAGELEEESLETIVEKIKEAKGFITERYVKAYLKALDSPQRALPPIPELTMVSDWTRMPFHTVDFGHGSAAYAYPLSPPLPQVAYLMQSPNDTGGIDVRIGLLKQDEQAFTRYFLACL